ncbi:4-oxalocrotonate decarboxylase [Nocardia panacis]|uniref:4-oxalocrotonate decarboxylase n=1 Tax=Nocardia panacis TaxID=2340916 RepID=A0A3A4K1W4_9NOCA|nr:fumarylacetoacetate hydrolase family protein [Nocardia panacis]RJO73760.1 4-oxalocrotonate decarboxylase [Nocardia panacis]
MTNPNIEALAARLDAATRTANSIAQLTLSHTLTLEDAYAVQRAGIAARVARGDGVVGVKLGLTSRAKAIQMGVTEVIAGVLTESMRIADGGTVAVGPMIHPRVEPEVAFRLDAAGAAIEVAPALEIIDSRYRDFKFRLADVVADNTSAARFAVGAWRPLADVPDLADLETIMAIDGVVAETGSTADILGHPLRAIETVQRLSRTHGLPLIPGAIVLAGAATAAVPLPIVPLSNVTVSVTGLGRVAITIGATDD